MPTLFEVCVWEGFSLDSLVVVDDDEEFELIELFELEGSPNVCFETNCNGVCDENTGKEESLQAGINIYPNPSNNHLNIETDISDLYNIEITSLNGQHLLSRELKGTTHQLNLSSFQKGVYIITIRSNDFVTTRKIIKL